MRPTLPRLGALIGAGALVLVTAGSALAASAAPLTVVVASDSTDAPAAGQAWVRVLHGSPDAPAVDVYVDGTKAITNLAFGKITDYTPVPAGDHAIKVCATGSTTVCPIDVPKLTVADGKKYTVAATDVLASITPQVIEDAPSAPSSEAAQLRVVHFSADTPAVDVYADGTKVVSDLAYPKATSYLAVPGATYSVKVCAAGSTKVCPIGPASLAIESGKAYSVFAVGSLAAASAGATAPPTDTEVVTSAPAPATSPVAWLALLAAAVLGSVLVTMRVTSESTRR
jgi:uncharacterized protein DUF4397